MTQKTLNVLITSGGTSEPIDNVRVITNLGTGRLGSLIADCFAEDEAVGNIFYVCAKNALRPVSDRVKEVPVGGVQDLLDAVEKLAGEYRIDAIVHSMAVSDYTVRSVTTVEKLAEFLSEKAGAEGTAEDIIRGLVETDERGTGGKLSSKMKDPLILLGPTPKVIGRMRSLAPDAVIVGFKLLDHVTDEVLTDTARALMEKNDCDMVLANDSASIKGDEHVGHLIGMDGFSETYRTKQEIARGIAGEVIRKAGEK